MTTTLPPLPGATTGAVPAPPRAPRARRRSPAVLALAIALVAAGGLGGAVLYNETGQRSAVLALAQNVPAGASITSADLVVAHISLDPALQPVGAASLTTVVGMRATADLKAGQFLTVSDVTRTSLVQSGQQVVGLPTKDTQLPAVPLEPGTQIVIIATGGTGSGETTGSPSSNGGSSGGGSVTAPVAGAQFAATVVTVGATDSDGSAVIDVAVPQAQASVLAVLAAAGNFAVVFAPEGGG